MKTKQTIINSGGCPKVTLPMETSPGQSITIRTAHREGTDVENTDGWKVKVLPEGVQFSSKEKASPERKVLHRNDMGDVFYEDENPTVYWCNNGSHKVEIVSNELRGVLAGNWGEQSLNTDIYRTEEEALLAGLKKFTGKYESLWSDGRLTNHKESILGFIAGNVIEVRDGAPSPWEVSKFPNFCTLQYRIKPSKETRLFQTDKVKIEWVIEDNKLSMQVLEMDERFRGKAVRRWAASNLFEVGSNNEPQISFSESFDRIYLRGTNTCRDNITETMCFPNEVQLQDYLTKAEEALTEWSEKWSGFRVLIHTNVIGEEFYEGEEVHLHVIMTKYEIGEYQDLGLCEICSDNSIKAYGNFCEVSLTKSGAYEIYSKHLKSIRE